MLPDPLRRWAHIHKNNCYTHREHSFPQQQESLVCEISTKCERKKVVHSEWPVVSANYCSGQCVCMSSEDAFPLTADLIQPRLRLLLESSLRLNRVGPTCSSAHCPAPLPSTPVGTVHGEVRRQREGGLHGVISPRLLQRVCERHRARMLSGRGLLDAVQYRA